MQTYIEYFAVGGTGYTHSKGSNLIFRNQLTKKWKFTDNCTTSTARRGECSVMTNFFNTFHHAPYIYLSKTPLEMRVNNKLAFFGRDMIENSGVENTK